MKPTEFDRLWRLISPLLPKEGPKLKGGRPRLSDKQVLRGILFILKTGTPWEKLPREMGCGSGMACWRRLRKWQEDGVWDRLHAILLDKLNGFRAFNWYRFCLDSSSVASPRGATKRQGRTRQTEAKEGPSAIL